MALGNDRGKSPGVNGAGVAVSSSEALDKFGEPCEPLYSLHIALGLFKSLVQ